MKLSYINLKTTEPDFNLAAEQYVFDCLPQDRNYFMLWQNNNAIIIGKYQNTLSEINEKYVKKNGISVVRRLSGGGAVYHDLGNLNFTFIADAGELNNLNMKLFCEPIVETLKSIGVEAEINGRNDITIDGKKFSGNSQYLRGGRIMHHGTIMFNSDLSKVNDALNVDQEKIESKGMKSVHSRVINILPYVKEDMDLSTFREILLKRIIKGADSEEYVFSPEDIENIKKIKNERYATWEWNYGKSPVCTLKKSKRIDGVGRIEAYISVEHGLISNVSFRGDFFSKTDPDSLSDLLIGRKPEPEEIRKALCNIDATQCFTNLKTEQLIELLTE
jgi:lipoyltransferase and lipoate-protein ligase